MVKINLEGDKYQITLEENDSIEIRINGNTQYTRTIAAGREANVQFQLEDTLLPPT